ncbi:Protein NRT1/ PTR FAMILY 8.3 [Hibiscus syriacus]|uniref:Protein NRT1/ PTR FAMILY 8.3 n=1 Tax=Hibiscus syriacus TaxID=106335 RepID=A0A6A2ZEE8_HIBSY|nr:Protein NRT1/ PTR FAMILY 8.3 [Hibiscus syriacus]
MIENDDIYTRDGMVDINKEPANKKKTGNWKACCFIIGNECCERLAYYGMGTNLVNYLKQRLNQGNVAASNNVTNWSGTCYISPLIGAFLADAYLGRYWTIAIFSIIYFFVRLKPLCNGEVCHPTQRQVAVFFVALYLNLIALGTGGIKTCVSSFGADRFDVTDEVERKKRALFSIGSTSRSISEHLSLIRFWFFDKPAVMTQNDYAEDSLNPWSLCTVTQVEKLKSVITLLLVWALGIIFATVHSQMNTVCVARHLSPYSTLSALSSGHLFLTSFEVYKNNYYDLKTIPMSIFWWIPQYFVVGCAEVFTFFRQIEFFYDQAPDAMRSLCSALSLTMVALGNYLSTVLVTAVTKIMTRNRKLG